MYVIFCGECRSRTHSTDDYVTSDFKSAPLPFWQLSKEVWRCNKPDSAKDPLWDGRDLNSQTPKRQHLQCCPLPITVYRPNNSIILLIIQKQNNFFELIHRQYVYTDAADAEFYRIILGLVYLPIPLDLKDQALVSVIYKKYSNSGVRVGISHFLISYIRLIGLT